MRFPKVKALLWERGWPQYRLAAELGVTETKLSRALSGRGTLPGPLWERAATILGVDVTEIIPDCKR